MASRLIHYLIAEEVTKVKNQMNRDRFVYGSLLPDLSLHDTFFEGLKEEIINSEIADQKI